MKSKFTLFTFCICYSSLIFAEQITTKVESDKIQKIEIQSTAGKVQIVSTNKKESTLIVDKVKISEKCLITTELKNEVLFAKAESSNNSPCEVNFLISAPFHANLDITVGSADIEIENMSGEIDYKSGSGDVVIKNSGNEIEGKSGSGNVIISGVVEEANITTGNGNINIERPIAAISLALAASQDDSIILL